ncbi:MAG: hypothetical protein P4M12_09950 [Gammaproteobacteria bacterium]|nr:hypothetical protein [Gammaproteobacteria bacterium]
MHNRTNEPKAPNYFKFCPSFSSDMKIIFSVTENTTKEQLDTLSKIKVCRAIHFSDAFLNNPDASIIKHLLENKDTSLAHINVILVSREMQKLVIPFVNGHRKLGIISSIGCPHIVSPSHMGIFNRSSTPELAKSPTIERSESDKENDSYLMNRSNT